MRTFIAVNLPNDVKEKIWQDLSEKIKQKGIKLVEKENLHITLLFIGEIPESYVEEIKRRLEPLSATKQFKISLNGIGCFAPRVLWVGLNEGKKDLEMLQKKVCELVGLNDKKFSAHLTIARNKWLSAKDFATLVDKLKETKVCSSFVVSSVDIMKSTLTKSGPIYEKIAEIKLSA
ncbi:MAG: RNA 2',3'-cyclic phosphodiesterase [Candidatus Diapherotrites archaeon]